MPYVVKVKDGDSSFDWDAKTNGYVSKTKDYVRECETFEDALQEFLSWTSDEYVENQVSLTFKPKKVKKKK